MDKRSGMAWLRARGGWEGGKTAMVPACPTAAPLTSLLWALRMETWRVAPATWCLPCWPSDLLALICSLRLPRRLWETGRRDSPSALKG